MDQAVHLREKAKEIREKNRPKVSESGIRPDLRVIAVTSGKGGVGKTNVTANLAIALAKKGKRVLVLDADLGLANMDILLGLTPQYNIQHILDGRKVLAEVIVEGPSNIKVLPAASGVVKMTNLSEDERLRLLSEFENYDEPLDILLIDTGAGISENVMYFLVAAQQTIIVATPDPTSITDAYAVMKVLSTEYSENRFLLLPNNVPGERAAKKIYEDLSSVASRFLNISIDLIGYIPADNHVQKAVRNRKAVLEMFPDSDASVAFQQLADRLLSTPVEKELKGNIQFFWRRLLKLN